MCYGEELQVSAIIFYFPLSYIVHSSNDNYYFFTNKGSATKANDVPRRSLPIDVFLLEEGRGHATNVQGNKLLPQEYYS